MKKRQLYEEKAAVWRKATWRKASCMTSSCTPMAFACPPWICWEFYFICICICKSIITPPPPHPPWKKPYVGNKVCRMWMAMCGFPLYYYLHVGIITVAFTIKPWPLRNPHNHVHKEVATDTKTFQTFWNFCLQERNHVSQWENKSQNVWNLIGQHILCSSSRKL